MNETRDRQLLNYWLFILGSVHKHKGISPYGGFSMSIGLFHPCTKTFQVIVKIFFFFLNDDTDLIGLDLCIQHLWLSMHYDIGSI